MNKPKPLSDRVLIGGMGTAAAAVLLFTFFMMGGAWLLAFVGFCIAVKNWGDDYIVPILFCLASIGIIAGLLGIA